MCGKTANISQFCEIGWYKWVKFYAATVSFLEDLLFLGKYLGPLIDIGLSITAKILTLTGRVVHCSTYRLLTHEELTAPVKQNPMTAFL